MSPIYKIYLYRIRRKTLYYMYNIVFPCMMMSTLTVLVFCMPPDSGEKIALGVTVILAFSVFMLAIAERMPETSESIPLIGNYISEGKTTKQFSIFSLPTPETLNLHDIFLKPEVDSTVPYFYAEIRYWRG